MPFGESRRHSRKQPNDIVDITILVLKLTGASSTYRTKALAVTAQGVMTPHLTFRCKTHVRFVALITSDAESGTPYVPSKCLSKIVSRRAACRYHRVEDDGVRFCQLFCGIWAPGRNSREGASKGSSGSLSEFQFQGGGKRTEPPTQPPIAIGDYE